MTTAMTKGAQRPEKKHATGASRAAALVLGALLLAGCASGPQAHPDDPLEPYNRSMTRFNDAVDAAVLKPVATAYQQATPAPVRTGVSNFFSNLGCSCVPRGPCRASSAWASTP